MSFQVWVIRASDLDWSNRECKRLLDAEFGSEDERNLALDEWQRASDMLHLFSEFFGGDSTVHKYWSGIAGKLRLPTLQHLYEHGLLLETAVQLEEFEHELNVLESYWESHSYELRDDINFGSHGQEREHLGESMQYLREAIRIARDNGASLGIT